MDLSVELRIARLGGGIAAIVRTPKTRAAHAVPVEPCRFRWLEQVPIAGYRFILDAPSSVGASVTFVALQSGVG
jgi:hypothetical protein